MSKGTVLGSDHGHDGRGGKKCVETGTETRSQGPQVGDGKITKRGETSTPISPWEIRGGASSFTQPKGK